MGQENVKAMQKNRSDKRSKFGNNRQKRERDRERERKNEKKKIEFLGKKFAFINELELKDKVIFVNRVTKVVKGGRIFRFAALVAVGDGKGYIGLGSGKASEVSEAVRKATGNAKKNLVFVKMNDNESIYHEIIGKFGASRVLIKPAKEGTGIIAGGPVRIIMELAGIKNVRSKSIGSRNKHNITKAVIEAFKNLKSPEDILKLHTKKNKD